MKQKRKKDGRRIGGMRLLAAVLAVFFAASFFSAHIYAKEEDSRQVLKVGFYACDGYHMINENGVRSGYGYDFLRLAARYLDVTYEYVGYEDSWEDMCKMLTNGEIDFVTSAFQSPEREEEFDFSKPIGTNSGILSIKSGNAAIVAQDYETYNDITVGMLKNDSRIESFKTFAKEKGFTYRTVYYPNIDELTAALEKGSVDAVVTNSLRQTENERIIERFDTKDFCAMVKKGNEELLEQINYAIDQMNMVEGDWKNELNNKYYAWDNEKNIQFSEEELEIIRQYASGEKTLTISANADRAPYSYVENGELKGIIPDYFAKIAEYAGIPYEVKVASSSEELIKWQEDGTANIIVDGRIPNESWIEEKDYALTEPYMTMKIAMVTRRDFTGDIKKIAVINSQGLFGIEEELAKDAEWIMVEGREAGMQAVLNGEADATFVYQYTAQEFVNRDERGLLNYVALESPTYDYRMILCNGVNHAMAGIITKCIYALPDGTIEEIATQYTNYKAENTTLFTLIRIHPALSALVLVMIIAMLLFMVALTMKMRENRKLIAIEQKKADEMANLAAREKAANDSKSRFLFSMSHDIRTPLNAVIGYTDLALDIEIGNRQLRDYLVKIRHSGTYLMEIINDVLEMSRIESKKVQLNERENNLIDLVEDVAIIVGGEARKKHQLFEVDLSQVQQPCVICDEVRVKEILVNLLNNSIKFTPEGGRVSFWVCQQPSDEVKWGNYEIHVKDNGLGIKEDFLNRLFEPFERECSSTISGIQGTGLGLSIVKGYVDLMKGTIDVVSKENHGTEFILRFCFKITEGVREKKVLQVSDNRKIQFHDKRVLLVEDNELNREIVSTILTKAGFTVVEADDGLVAVEKVKESKGTYFDVILMDIQMPGMDGYTATREIRSLPDRKMANVPIIALSANAFEEDRKESLQAGMNAHIAKPLQMEELVRTLAQVLIST